MINIGFHRDMSKEEKEVTLEELKKKLVRLRKEQAKKQIADLEHYSPPVKRLRREKKNTRKGKK